MFSGGFGGLGGFGSIGDWGANFEFGPDYIDNMNKYIEDMERRKAEDVLAAHVLETLGGRSVGVLAGTTRGMPGVVSPVLFGRGGRKKQRKQDFRFKRQASSAGVNISNQQTGAQI